MPFIINRRGFVSLVTVTGLGIAAFQPDLARAATIRGAATEDIGEVGRLTVALPGTTVALRDRIHSLMPAGLAQQVDWHWSHTSGVSWSADTVQSHSRYTPSPYGAKLPDTGAGWSNAAAIEPLPYAVLVNQDKAQRAGVESFDLTGMRKRGVRPLFPFSGTGSAPENSWMLPTLATVVSRDPAKLKGAARTLSGVIGSQLRHLELRSSDETGSLAGHERLLDPASDLVAMYGSPVLLEAARKGRSGGAVSVVSLQDFLHISRPSLFATSMLQAGYLASPALAAPVMKALREPRIRQLLTTQARHGLLVAPNVDTLIATHESGYYAGIPELSYFTDGGLLAALVIDIQAAFIWSADEKHKATNDLQVAQYALSSAQSRIDNRRALGIPLQV